MKKNRVKVLFLLALKGITRHIILSFLTVLGIGSGIAVILAVSIVNTSIEDSILKVSRELGTGNTDIWIEEKTENTPGAGTKLEGFEEKIINEIKKMDGIKSIHPALSVYAAIYTEEKEHEKKEAIVYGIVCPNDSMVRNHILSKGNLPQSDNEIIIGEKLAGFFHLGIGSLIILNTPQGEVAFKISGILKADEGSGLLNNNYILFADLDSIQKYFNHEGRITSLNIVLKKDTRPEDIITQLKVMLPENLAVTADPLFQTVLTDQTGRLRISTFFFSFISIFIAVFIIYNTFFSSIEQHRRETGLLRLVGMTGRQVFLIYLIQSLIYSFLGSFFGLFIGIVLSAGLLYSVSLVFNFQSFFFTFPSFFQIIFSCSVGIFVTVITCVLPAVNAAQISPLSMFTLNEEREQKRKKAFLLKKLTGFTLIAVGIILEVINLITNYFPFFLRFITPFCILIGFILIIDIILPLVLRSFLFIFKRIFKLPFILAIKTLLRRLKRTIVTVCAISITVAIIISFMGMTGSIKKTVSGWLDHTRWANLIIYSVSGSEINESIKQKLNQYSFIKEINPMRYIFVPYEHQNLSDNGFLFQGIEPEIFFDFTGMEVIDNSVNHVVEELSQNKRTILINKNLSEKIGLQQGDTVTLHTKRGEVDFYILGTVIDHTDFIHRLGKVVYGSIDTLTDFWDAGGYTILQAHLINGFQNDRARSILYEDLSKDFDIKIITHDEEREEIGLSIDKIFSIFYLINAVFYLIVFFGIFQTVLINVFYQLYELTVLRITGCTKGQIKLIIFFEALVMTLTGGIFAGIIGLWLGSIFTFGSSLIMGTMTYFIPLSTVALLIIINIIIAALASIYPQYLSGTCSLADMLVKYEHFS